MDNLTVQAVINQVDKANLIGAEVIIREEVLKLVVTNVGSGAEYYLLHKKTNGQENRMPCETLELAVQFFNFMALFA